MCPKQNECDNCDNYGSCGGYRVPPKANCPEFECSEFDLCGHKFCMLDERESDKKMSDFESHYWMRKFFKFWLACMVIVTFIGVMFHFSKNSDYTDYDYEAVRFTERSCGLLGSDECIELLYDDNVRYISSSLVVIDETCYFRDFDFVLKNDELHITRERYLALRSKE